MVSILYGVYFNVKEFYRAEFNINQSEISVDLQGVLMRLNLKKYRRVQQHIKLLWEIAATFNTSLWKRVIGWERSRAASGYGIIWWDADRNKQEEFSVECHSVDWF